MSRVADRLVALTLAAIDTATGSGDFGNARRWRDSMERAIRTGHTAAFIAGVNERLNKPAASTFTTARNLSRVERRELNDAINKQLKYLDRFAGSLDNLTPAQIAARAEMYAGAVRQTYNAQRWGAWDIPPELLPGSQTCLTRCRCDITVSDNGDGTGVLTRTLNGEAHCDECPPLAGDHPVKRRRA